LEYAARMMDDKIVNKKFRGGWMILKIVSKCAKMVQKDEEWNRLVTHTLT
jgi:hypothetical protein